MRIFDHLPGNKQIKPIKMIVLSLTGKCNFSCVYCYAAEHNQELMSFATAQKAVNMAAENGEPFILQFSGGEPLLNFACLKQILQYLKENKIKAIAQIQTNGSLLTKETALFLRQYNCAIGLSLDGKPEINNQMRKLPDGRGATNEIIHGFNVLRQNGIGCGITCVVTNTNVDHLAGIIDLAHYLGNVRKIGFDLLRGQGRGRNLAEPAADKIAPAMKNVYARAAVLSKATGIEITFAQLERVKTLANNAASCFGHCYAMNGEAIHVDAKGDIYGCASLVGEEEYCAGNVDTGRSSAKQQAITDKIKTRMHFCFVCPDFKLCGGGCYARWLGGGQTGPYRAECALKRVSIEEYVKRGCCTKQEP
ncbi:MAG: radical SAM protein [Sporomusaceae bacterium]|jgi:uncharacterized protein|nr:radical SAM protein [Sporomusaceae bacterium]